MDEAIDHLHANGSGHTECIVTGETIMHSILSLKACFVVWLICYLYMLCHAISA